MSSLNLSLVLSPQAEDDFADILQYTFETWGKAQFDNYLALINEALLTLQQHPHIGRLRPELSAQHGSFPAGQHLIIYRISENSVRISRVLHSRMDIKRYV